MKKSIFTKMGAAAMVLTLVTASLVGGTFAKYTSTVTGAGTATVAKWNISLKNGSAEITEDAKTITLINDNPKLTLDEGIVAPGAFGKLDLSVDGTGTQVDVEYTLKIDTTKLPSNIKFYKGDSAVPENEYKSTGISGKLTGATKTETIPVYWVWEDDGSNDAADLAAGTASTAGTATTFDITLTATQITDNTSAN